MNVCPEIQDETHLCTSVEVLWTPSFAPGNGDKSACTVRLDQAITDLFGSFDQVRDLGGGRSLVGGWQVR